MKFSVVGYYLYGAPASGNALQGQLYLRPLREAVAALPASNLVTLPLKIFRALWMKLSCRWITVGVLKSMFQVSGKKHTPHYRLFSSGSLLESGGRPVTRRVEQAIWPADTLPGIRPQFATQPVYDYSSNTTVKNRWLMKTVLPVLTSFMPMRRA